MQTAHIYTQQLTTYRSGVCIGNWVEADVAQELAAQATSARFTATTTVQDTYRPEGRYGNAMLLSAVRQDLERQHACTGREMLFKHGGMGQPPVSCYASLKGLTDAQVLELRQPKVENFLWIGQKRNDSQVPLSDSRLQRLLASKMQQWKADRNCPRFTTTSKDSMDKVAHLARGHMTKQPALAPSSAAEGALFTGLSA
eukprot:jgi/Astpho2/1397/Aster-x1006